MYELVDSIASRTAPVGVYVNGRLNGVYNLVEGINDQWVDHRFDEPYDDTVDSLDKETWPSDSNEIW